MVYCDHIYLDVLWYTVIARIWMCYGFLRSLDIWMYNWYTAITDVWMCSGIQVITDLWMCYGIL